MKNFEGRLLLVGAGKMGTALVQGWLQGGMSPKNIFIRDPAISQGAIDLLGRYEIPYNVMPVSPPDTVILAIKPQTAEAAMEEIKAQLESAPLTISIMAGKSLEWLEAHVPANTPVIRTMPNTPASIGKSITVAIANKAAKDADRHTATQLLQAIGGVEWIGHEGLMDAVTAVSGSGPAYVFLLAEALSKAGMASGLSQKLADKLSRETIIGAAALMAASEETPQTLRENVTSPGGTTAAALSVLMSDQGLEKLMTDAVAAATWRSKELGG